MAILYRHIAELRPEWKIVLFGEDDIRSEFPDNVEKRIFRVPGYRLNLWENVAFPILARLTRADVMHCTSSSAPFLPMTPVVMTVHDIIPILREDGQSPSAAKRFKKQLAAGLDHARIVVAVSQHTKDDLVAHFEIDRDKIRVIHWGVDVPEMRTAVAQFDPAALEVTSPYFIAFGGDARRKNTSRVIQAFAALPHTAPQLVVVGVDNPETRAQLRALASGMGCGARVVILNYVDDSSLEHLLSGATALIYVSLYEGFGLPLLEAMVRGVPIVASNTSSIPEVIGDAAPLVDPSNTEEIARTLTAMVEYPELRSAWGAKGKKRAQMFSWSSTAAETISVFESAVHGSPIRRGERRRRFFA